MTLQQYAEKWDRDPDSNFAVACYDQNSLAELREALHQRGADRVDMRTWGLTRAAEWREALQAALGERLIDRAAATHLAEDLDLIEREARGGF